MRSLTSRRRHKAVRPLLMLLALLVTGTLYSLAAPPQQSSADTSLVATGKGLFTQSCASCHGLGGEGTSAGPAITDVGALAVDFEVSTGRMPKAGPAIQSAPKVNLFTQTETDALADREFRQNLGHENDPMGPPLPPNARSHTPGWLASNASIDRRPDGVNNDRRIGALAPRMAAITACSVVPDPAKKSRMSCGAALFVDSFRILSINRTVLGVSNTFATSCRIAFISCLAS